jgi:hypothetical protein
MQARENSDVGYVYPHRCWSCMVPCLIREDFVCDEVDGKMYTYCSEGCRWTHKVAFGAANTKAARLLRWRQVRQSVRAASTPARC